MAYSAAIAVAVAEELGEDREAVARGAASYEPTGSRMRVVRLREGRVILDDCYNANPDSTQMAILSAADLGGRLVCILGDMLELGERSEEFHRETGRAALDAGALLLTTGELSAVMGGEHYGSKAALIADLPKRLRRGDVVLVKASHSMAFEEISEALREIKL